MLRVILASLFTLLILPFLLVGSPFTCSTSWVKYDKQLNRYTSWWKTYTKNMGELLLGKDWHEMFL